MTPFDRFAQASAMIEARDLDDIEALTPDEYCEALAHRLCVIDAELEAGDRGAEDDFNESWHKLLMTVRE